MAAPMRMGRDSNPMPPLLEVLQKSTINFRISNYKKLGSLGNDYFRAKRKMASEV
jgi:hypothetical protein